MALISQECGVSALASLGLNAMAPDEGNMHTLLIAGDDEQLETYLRPLAEGRTRSCFAMTEPGVASSDPTNLETTAVRDGDVWVLNGRKWCITGADGAAFAIVVAKTGDDDAAGHRNYSLILVPTDTPGWRIVRHPEWMGSHSPGGHPEIELSDVRVPLGNLLGSEGEGFVIAQKRLAGGRLAHAMRWIGVAQRALDLSAQRLLTRKAFGKELARHQGLQFMLADSRDGPLRQPADGAPHGLEGGARPPAPPGGRDDQDVRVGGVRPDRGPRGADARRRRDRDGPADRAHLPGRPRRADLRRRERGAPHGDRPRHAQARDAGRVGARRQRGAVSPHAIAADDIVRTPEQAGAREPLLVLDPLLRFLDAHGLGAGEPEIEPIGDGHSNVTYALRRGSAELVVRRPPRGPLPPSAHDVLREARVLRALEGRAPVPRVLEECDDPGVIGAPFYVMERIEGEVISDAVPAALDTEAERRRMGEELVDALVTVHAVDWRAAGLEGFGRPDGYLERQIKRFSGLWERNRTRDLPAVERVGRWLARPPA